MKVGQNLREVPVHHSWIPIPMLLEPLWKEVQRAELRFPRLAIVRRGTTKGSGGLA